MKICKECGKEFQPEHPKAIFCSPKCRQKDYRKKIAAKLEELKKLKESPPKIQDLTKPTNELKPPESTAKSNYTINTQPPKLTPEQEEQIRNIQNLKTPTYMSKAAFEKHKAQLIAAIKNKK